MGTNKSYHIQGKKGRLFYEQLKGVNLEKVLIVSIDVAKLHQKALFCNYFGEIVEKPFFFSVNVTGIELLCSKINHAISLLDFEKVFIGLEATGHYYEDIVRVLALRGFNVQIINAYSISEARSKNLNWSKTDDLDLLAIADCIISNVGTEFKLPTGSHKELLTFTRTRRQEVRKRSSLQMEIRVIMDHIWREFQGFASDDSRSRKKIKIFSDMWGKSSLFFLENFPHPSYVLELGEIGLTKISKEFNLKLRKSTIEKLLYAARESLSREVSDLQSEFLVLKIKLENLKNLNTNISLYEKEIETLLLQTDGILLLSTPGIGVVSAAELYCEIGDISHYENPGQIIKKAGTNPIVKQSGGGKGFYGKISKQGNPHLRYVIFNIGRCLANHNEDLKPFVTRLKDKGKHSRKVFIALGNKFIKIAFALLRDKKPFISKSKSIEIKHEINKKLKYNSFSKDLISNQLGFVA